MDREYADIQLIYRADNKSAHTSKILYQRNVYSFREPYGRLSNKANYKSHGHQYDNEKRHHHGRMAKYGSAWPRSLHCGKFGVAVAKVASQTDKYHGGRANHNRFIEESESQLPSLC